MSDHDEFERRAALLAKLAFAHDRQLQWPDWFVADVLEATARFPFDVFEEAVRRVQNGPRSNAVIHDLVSVAKAIQRHRDDLERGRTPALCADTAKPGYASDLLAERARRDPGSFAARYVARTRPLPVRDVPAPLTDNEKRLRALKGLAQVLSVDSSAAQPAPTARAREGGA